MTEKRALCYRPTQNGGPYIENWDFFMMPRSVVDDPNRLNPAIQQLIPYVSFYRSSKVEIEGEMLDSLDLLSYSRGKQSDEGRLVDRRSIGFGGHIDKLPENDNIVQLLHDEIKREIKEELHIDLNSKKLYAAIIASIRVFNYLMVNDGTVNAVHTGLSILLCLDEHLNGQEFKLEEGHIEDLQWLPLDGLTSEILDPYEVWSKQVVSGLMGKFYEFRQGMKQAAEMTKQMNEAQARGHMPDAAATAAMLESTGGLKAPVSTESLNAVSQLAATATSDNTDDVTARPS
jgi:predicted NUDIX family phosphoesterase